MEKRYGFIHEKLDIKILILFVLSRLPEPVELDTLADVVICDGGISYFDFAECVASLCETEHLYIDCGKYGITDKGRRNGEITESSLPYSVRIKAEKGASALRSSLMRDSMIKTARVIRRGGGYDVSLSLSDGIGEVMSAVLFASDEKQAINLEEGFRKKAEQVYNKMLEAILE